jgi:hypothetical protein
MKGLADQNQLFICAGAEFGYNWQMHDALKLLLNATGMPIWIPSEKTHAWEYKPQFPRHGWYEEFYIGGSSDFSIDGWNINYDLSAPNIYVGHCNSPFLLLECPFSWRSNLFFNSTLFASLLPKDKKARADNIASELVNDVVNHLEESANQSVIDNVELPSYGSGIIDYGTEEIETNEVIDTLSDFLDEIKIELSDNLLDPNLL